MNTLYETVKNSRSRHDILNKCDVAGSYDFYTLIVSMDSIDSRYFGELQKYSDQIKSATQGRNPLPLSLYELAKKFFPLAVHEYTHFVDCTSTLWGIKYLHKMGCAYVADDRRYNGKETDFFQAKEFHDLVRFAKLPNYYTYKPGIANNDRPWSAQVTIGKRFNSSGEISDHPILFVWFKTLSGIPIVRSPISTISILECSAMSQEIALNIDLIKSLNDVERTIEAKQYQKNLLEYIYNQDLTEYSVCAHLIANRFKQKDIVETFKLCSVVCRHVLNTPSAIFLKISKSGAAEKVFGPDAKEWVDSVNKGLESCEIGFLFYLLCETLPEDTMNHGKPIKVSIKEAYEKLGVQYKELVSMSKSDFASISREIKGLPIDQLKVVAQAGDKNYKKISWNSPALKYEMLNVPPVLLNDGEQIDVFISEKNVLLGINLEDFYSEFIEGQIWVERFVEVCA